MRMACLLLLICLLIAPPVLAETRSTMRNLTDDVGLDQHLHEQLPLDLMLTDEAGRAVRLGDYFGDKPVIITCVYFRCPMLCTEVLNGLLKSSQAIPLTMGKDYTVLSISIDPNDTPAMAAAKKDTYVRSYRRAGAEEGWHFLTATPEVIERVTKAVGFRYRYDPVSDQYAHASGIILATPEGKLSRYFYGVDYPPGDLRLALVESSQNKIGTLVDQVLLLCFHYNPTTGRYGFAVSAALQVASLALVIGGGYYLARMFRLEQRRAAALTWSEER